MIRRRSRRTTSQTAMAGAAAATTPTGSGSGSERRAAGQASAGAARRQPRTRSRLSRWLFGLSVVVLLASLGFGAYYLVQMLFEIPEERAAARSANYHETLDALDDVIPDLAIVSELITDPGEDGFIQGLVTIIQLDDRSGDVHAIASEPLPDVPPLAPTGPIDELEGVQNRMLAIVDRSETIGKRLSDTISYRQAFDRAFQLPTLPLTATGLFISQIEEDIDLMLEESVAAAANLPDDEFFSEHRADVDALISWLAAWRDGYLAALRGGDAERASDLVGEANRRVTSVRRGIEQPLIEAREWSSGEIDELDREVDDALLLTE